MKLEKQENMKKKRQEGRLFGMLFGTWGVSMLGNMLTGKGVMRAGKWIVRAGEGIVRATRGYNNMDHMNEKF